MVNLANVRFFPHDEYDEDAIRKQLRGKQDYKKVLFGKYTDKAGIVAAIKGMYDNGL